MEVGDNNIQKEIAFLVNVNKMTVHQVVTLKREARVDSVLGVVTFDVSKPYNMNLIS